MHSLRTRFTLAAVILIVFAVTAVTILSVWFIRQNEHRQADQLLLMLSETGERNLDYYFNSVEKSVAKVSAYVERNLERLGPERMSEHMEYCRNYFDEIANKTSGVLTYYYRVDPEFSQTETGFWYTNLDGTDFVAHEVTDITLYDTRDTAHLVWFTVPKYENKAVWLPPYITDNLDVLVFSYNVPIHWRGQFVGVVGIEIDYSAMAEMVDSIRLYSNGYAFLNDNEGNLFYHPRIDVTQLTDETRPEPPDGLISDSTFLRYTFEGEDKLASWLELCNGMRLTVSVPYSEADGEWKTLISDIVLLSIGILVVLSMAIMLYSGRITKPLEDLTLAAQQVYKGNYDFKLDYDRDDEVGHLTKTFKLLARHTKDHIVDLNKRVYVDALTSVKNKGAFSMALDELQRQTETEKDKLAFAVGVFDCDNLKTVNDQYGHDKGDAYLKAASGLICRVFQHSPVFRIGGDEFAVILKNADFDRRDLLVEDFRRRAREISSDHDNIWEQVHVAIGLSVYDPNTDGQVIDTVRRADARMYEDKRRNKKAS